MPFFNVINSDVVFALAQKLELGRVVIAADEMWKLTRSMKASLSERDQQKAMGSITAMYKHGWSLVCSGLKVSDAMDMATMSGRETKQHFLCTSSEQTRDDYAPMLAYLKEAFPEDEFTPTLRALYEIAKNVPGYLGMWIEAKAMHERCKRRSRDVRCIVNIETPFVKVLFGKLLDNPRLFTDYWRAVVNRQEDVKESDVCHTAFSPLWRVLVPLCLEGALLPRSQRVEEEQDKQVSKHDLHGVEQRGGGSEQVAAQRYYLSPLALTHPLLKSAREYSLIATAVGMLRMWGPWTSIEKGKALEAMLVVRLALTAAYVNDAKARMINPAREVSVGTLIKRLCGKAHVHVDAHKDAQKVDEGLPAAFPDYSAPGFSLADVSKSEVQKAKHDLAIADYDAVTNGITGKVIVKDLSAFPAVWSQTKGGGRMKGPFAVSKRAMAASCLAENIAALNSPHFSVLSPQCPLNAGCGAALLGGAVVPCGQEECGRRRGRAEKVLLLFETKHYVAGSGALDTPESISTKAFHALHGVSQYVNTCNIRRVCFVYCNTGMRGGGANAVIHHSSAHQKGPFMMEHDCGKPVDDPGKHLVLPKKRRTTLSEMMRTLGDLGCTTSLHTVWTENEWCDLLDSLYLMVPDIDEVSVDEETNPTEDASLGRGGRHNARGI
ncbi:Hypothetical protein, putative [Bodo saltans]|uniref:Uncharacterized protein n=1 Tax=Bodo saltans TaxID=75058 RepID=A0A0S4IL07_BODSA|nr:Hypothetical protein, putative [Bodo saltans]|eukprot:CUF17833.1 Hypothetical protein, putative [Bodo saltans]